MAFILFSQHHTMTFLESIFNTEVTHSLVWTFQEDLVIQQKRGTFHKKPFQNLLCLFFRPPPGRDHESVPMAEIGSFQWTSLQKGTNMMDNSMWNSFLCISY